MPSLIPFSIDVYTTKDGTNLAYRWWSGQPGRGVIVHLHGIQSHGGWFTHSCSAYARAGFSVFAPDRRGSGLNKALGTAELSARLLLEDLTTGIEHAIQRADTDRFHIVGVSWGGKLALAHTRARSPRPISLVLIAPGLVPRVGYPLWRKMLVIFALLTRRHAAFPIPITKPDMFTDTPSWRRFIAEDRKMLRACDASLFLADRQLGRITRRPTKIALPDILLCLADRDRIIDNERTKREIEALPAKSITVRQFPHTCHTLEFEPCPSVWIKAILRWLEHLDAPQFPLCFP